MISLLGVFRITFGVVGASGNMVLEEGLVLTFPDVEITATATGEEFMCGDVLEAAAVAADVPADEADVGDKEVFVIFGLMSIS